VEPHEVETLIRRLSTIAVSQERIDDDIRAVLRQQQSTHRRLEETASDIRAFVQQQTVVNAQNTTLILRISRTLDLIDEKLERLVPPQP
jgi:hypothetical protein